MTLWIAGVDEAGRGPLAGPVVAAAVILDPARPVQGLRDSKLLSALQRERLAPEIRAAALAWAVAEASVEEIDALNILRASLLAMRRALAALPRPPVRISIDGNKAPQVLDLFPDCVIETVVGGDRTVPAISAASILAKVHRDALMLQLDQRYPGYGFARHQGYGTPAHQRALRELGPSSVHRRSFAPVKSLLVPPYCKEASPVA
jgi:ribonuclease HII